MTAIQRFKKALHQLEIDETVVAEIMEGHEQITDRAPKKTRAEFFARAMQRLDARLDFETRRDLRAACACSKGGWRLKAAQKVAKDLAAEGMEARLEALRQVMHMGNPVLNADGTITASIGEVGGFECPCPVFQGAGYEEPVSITYCYCCAGHFQYHYQIALGKKLVIRTVLSSALASGSQAPCRFVFEIAD